MNRYTYTRAVGSTRRVDVGSDGNDDYRTASRSLGFGDLVTTARINILLFTLAVADVVNT